MDKYIQIIPSKSSLSTNSNTSSFISELPGFDKSKFIPSETSSPLPIHKTIGSPDPNELRAALARCSADKKVRLGPSAYLLYIFF